MFAYAFNFQLVLDIELALVQAAELVDLVLVFPSDLDLVTRRLVLF